MTKYESVRLTQNAQRLEGELQRPPGKKPPKNEIELLAPVHGPLPTPARPRTTSRQTQHLNAPLLQVLDPVIDALFLVDTSGINKLQRPDGLAQATIEILVRDPIVWPQMNIVNNVWIFAILRVRLITIHTIKQSQIGMPNYMSFIMLHECCGKDPIEPTNPVL